MESRCPSIPNPFKCLPPLINRRKLRFELRQPGIGLRDCGAVVLVKRRVGHRLVQLLNLGFEGLDARGQRFELACVL